MAEVTPIVTLRFTVNDPVGINGAYGMRKSEKGGRGQQYLRKPAAQFKEAVAIGALTARFWLWPCANLWRAARVRVSYQLYDSNLDADGPRKLIRDALEGILYVNDRVVDDGPAARSIKDGKGRRVEIVVDLLEMVSNEEADRLHFEYTVASVKRLQARDRKRKLAG